MRNFQIVVALITIFSAQAIFADDQDMGIEGKPCAVVAKACVDAGYSRGADNNKKFWVDCMKPTILGQAVNGVTVDADVVKQCRTNKIADLKEELSEFEKASS